MIILPKNNVQYSKYNETEFVCGDINLINEIDEVGGDSGIGMNGIGTSVIDTSGSVDIGISSSAEFGANISKTISPVGVFKMNIAPPTPSITPGFTKYLQTPSSKINLEMKQFILTPTLTPFSTTKPSITTTPLKIGTTQPSFTTTPSRIGTTQPSFTTTPSRIGTTQPSFTTTPSRIGTTQPSFTTTPSRIGIAQPSFITTPSRIDIAQPSFTTTPYGIGTNQHDITNIPNSISTPIITTTGSKNIQDLVTIPPSEPTYANYSEQSQQLQQPQQSQQLQQQQQPQSQQLQQQQEQPQQPQQQLQSNINFPQNCQYTDWSNWSSCVPGSSKRTRKQNTIPPLYGGEPCSSNIEEDNTFCPINSTLAGWSDWSPCITGSTKRTRTQITNPPVNNGKVLSVKTEIDNSTCSIDCEYTGWTEWSTCAPGNQNRTRVQTFTGPINNGKPCNPQTQIDTLTCPVDSTIIGWSDWTTCSPNSQNRTRFQITRPPINNGATVAVRTEIDPSTCPVDSIVTGWSDWTTCSPNNQNRTRFQITRPPINNGATVAVQTQIDPSTCPVDCKYNGWSEYSACNSNSITRIRYPMTIPPINGGTSCTLAATKDISLSDCPVNCTVNYVDGSERCNTDDGTYYRTYNVTSVSQNIDTCTYVDTGYNNVTVTLNNTLGNQEKQIGNAGTCCTISNWTSNDSGCSTTECGTSGTFTRTWTKSGTCVSGIQHPVTETINCVGACKLLYYPFTNNLYNYVYNPAMNDISTNKTIANGSISTPIIQSEYIKTPTINLYSSFTIGIWYKYNNYNGVCSTGGCNGPDITIFTCYNSNNDEIIKLSWKNDMNGIGLYSNNTEFSSLNSGIIIDKNLHFYCITIDSKQNCNFYIDGNIPPNWNNSNKKIINDKNYNFIKFKPDKYYFTLGYGGNSNFANSSINNFFVLNQALTQTDVMNLKNNISSLSSYY